MATERETHALLLIADISGYTEFLRLHALATSHARQIIARLLKALVAASRPPLCVAELEGDAVFFYALAKGGDLQPVAEDLKRQILRLYRAFDEEIRALQRVKACVCEACTKVGQLRLKQVAHCGDVSIERIDRFEKLFGLDVIVVHRMLKNTVPARDYLMMTEPVYSACLDFYSVEPERRVELLDGIGDVEMVVFYRDHLAPLLERLPEAARAPSTAEVLLWKLKMHARTIAGLLGLRGKPEAWPPLVTPAA